ncbi:MAG: tetratricopeptide repeat protein [Candidatus Zixiibacteriota bacterium]|nr:MAG: tetratricopeptide repeat protein [candidate division Zixibacteria bacterium]
MNKSRFLTALVLLLAGPALADDYVDLVDRGNEAFRKQDYKKALEFYNRARTELPVSPELDYNIAGALHQQGNYEETVDKYSSALGTDNVVLEAGTHYNLGNTYYRMGDYQNAILAYQRALDIDPGDIDAKFNLELARRMLKEQIKPEQQDDQQQQQQQQQQQEKQQQPQQNQQQNEQQQEQQQNQDQQEQQNQEQQQPQEQQPRDDKDISREDAERILNALRDDEQETQKKIKRRAKASDYLGKDW